MILEVKGSKLSERSPSPPWLRDLSMVFMRFKGDGHPLMRSYDPQNLWIAALWSSLECLPDKLCEQPRLIE